jgi:hypothetical protein
MNYLLGGLGILTVVSWLATYFLWNQYEDERANRAVAEATIAVQKETIRTMGEQVNIAKATLAEQRQENTELVIQMQKRDRDLNQMRLTIERQAYESPYRNSIDTNNWFADWMRSVESATGYTRPGTDNNSTGETSTIDGTTGTD